MVYVAAPLSTRTEARDLAAAIRSAGHNVVSSWHDIIDGPTVDPLDDHGRLEISAPCVAEVMSADAMIVRCAPGAVPRGTLYEAGVIHGAWEANRSRFGHASGMPIVWLLVDGAPLPCIFARSADAVSSARGHGPESRAVLRRLGQS